MSDANLASSSQDKPANVSVLAGFLSYLIPGLGQISQGRVGKGLLFMICLPGLFFYGMYLGNWSNVYLPDSFREDRLTMVPLIGRRASIALVDRLPFAGQFWIGVSAWPALAQYNDFWPVGEQNNPFWRDFQRAPSEERINELQRDGDKNWDLGLVCTVIAGVLNILVIYDAYAGPAFQGEAEPTRREEETAPA